MDRGLPDIPERLAEKIEVRNDRDVQDHHIIEVFLETERPFVPVSFVAAEFGMSSQGMRNRLEELASKGVLNSCPGANGQVYWVDDPQSNWPIPPDVVVEGGASGVEPEYTEILSDLTSRLHVQLLILAVGLGLIQGLLITTVLTLAYLNVDVLGVVGDRIVLFILLTSILSVVFGVSSLVMWRVQKYRDGT